MSEQAGQFAPGGERAGAEVEVPGDHVERAEPTAGPVLEPPHGDPIPDPGVEPDVVRLADVDPKLGAASRTPGRGHVRALASLLVIGFVIAFVFLPIADQGEDVVAAVRNSNLALGLTLGLALFLIGTGAIHWAKKLMPDHEVVHERHSLRSTDEVRAAALAEFEQGAEDSGFGRRKLIRNSLIGAMLLLPLPAVVLLRDLGPLPGNLKNHTLWGKDVRVMTDAPEPRPLRRPTSRSGHWSTPCRRPSRTFQRRARPPQRAGEVGGDHGPDVAGGDQRRRRAGRTGASRASWPTPRSAPTSAARSTSTSRRRTTCSAPATSPPSTSPTTAR